MMRARSAVFPAALYLFLLFLWDIWRVCGAAGTPVLFDAAVAKPIVWALLPGLVMLRRKTGWQTAPCKLFAAPFPWLACITLLSATTATLYTLRLANGLVNTYPIFDPMFLVFSLSAGVEEELSFRGYFYNSMEPALGFWPAAIINGAMFTLYHYPWLLFGRDWGQLLSLRTLLLFIMGVIFCRMLHKWRNLTLNMVVHTVWDILSYLFCLAG